jgi:hypothetical protein
VSGAPDPTSGSPPWDPLEAVRVALSYRLAHGASPPRREGQGLAEVNGARTGGQESKARLCALVPECPPRPALHRGAAYLPTMQEKLGAVRLCAPLASALLSFLPSSGRGCGSSGPTLSPGKNREAWRAWLFLLPTLPGWHSNR